MPITLHRVDQRSGSWFNLRNKTAVTGSIINQVITSNYYSKGLSRLISEKTSGIGYQLSNVAAVDHGIKCEVFALRYLKERYGIIYDAGFVTNSLYPDMGASPDGVIANYMDTGSVLLEIKCPYSRALTGEIPSAYFNQMQFQMMICNMERCLYVEAKYPPGTSSYIEPTEFNAQIVQMQPGWYAKHCDKIQRFIDAVHLHRTDTGYNLIEILRRETTAPIPDVPTPIETKPVCLLDF